MVKRQFDYEDKYKNIQKKSESWKNYQGLWILI